MSPNASTDRKKGALPMSVARLIFSSFVLGFPLVALAQGYQISVRAGSQLVSLSFATTENFPEVCWLEARRLVLELPAAAEGAVEASSGRIEIVTRVDASRPCLQVEGPRRGVVALANEDAARLPGLPFGRYRVTIDGRAYGVLLTTRHSAEWFPDAAN
jgi:hypothetical protein